MIAMAGGGDKNSALFAERLAGVVQQVHEHLRKMPALHEQRRKTLAKFPPDFYPGRHRGRKHLSDGAVELLDDA